MGARRRLILAALLALATTARAQSWPHVGTLGVSTCMPVTGSVSPLYMAPGTCVDPTESIAQPVEGTATFARLSCWGNAEIGTGHTVSIVARSGACGTLADQSFACSLVGGAGAPSCSSANARLVLLASQCWDLKLTFSGLLATGVWINCSLERAM